MDQVCRTFTHLAWQEDYFLGIDADARRHLDARRRRRSHVAVAGNCPRAELLGIELHGGGDALRKPIQTNVRQQEVAGVARVEIAVAIAPAPSALQQPSREPDGRIIQCPRQGLMVSGMYRQVRYDGLPLTTSLFEPARLASRVVLAA